MSVLEEFLNSRKLAESTYKSYTYHLKRYETFIGKSLDVLIEEAEEEEDTGVRLRKRKVNEYINDYRQHLEDLGRSPKHVDLSIRIIRNFYHEFDIQLPRSRNKQKINKNAGNIKNLPDKDDIRKAVTYANLEYKEIIFLMVSSGMGSSEVRNLKYKDFCDSIKYIMGEPSHFDPLDIDELISQLKDIDVVPEWTIMRQKTHNFYYTFSSPESTNAILTYLEDDPVESMEDYLFQNNKGRQISDITFSTYFRRLNDTCKFGNTGRMIHFRSHNLRKIFTSNLYAAGLPQLTIDWLLGHQIDQVTESYFKADTSKLKTEYLKVLENLTFTEKVKTKTVTSKEYDMLIKESRTKDSKIVEMERRVEEMEKRDKERDAKLEEILSNPVVLKELSKK